MTLSGGSFAFNLAFKRAYVGTNGFSAKLLVEIKEPSGKVSSLTQEICQSGHKLRTQFKISEMKGVPAQAGLILQKLSMDEMVLIMDSDTKDVLFLFPGLRAFTSAQATKPLVEFIESSKAISMERMPLGDETLDTHTCQKVKLREPGKRTEAVVWLREDLGGFPAKIEIANAGDLMTLRSNDVNLAEPSKSIFEVPAGYTRYSNYGEIVQEARKRSEIK